LPKIQAKKFRLQDAIFEANTPKRAKEKLRAALPAGATLRSIESRMSSMRLSATKELE